MIEGDWCVAVFKCKPLDVRRVLIDFYNFVKDLEGVKSLHFIVKDRMKNDVVLSFRMLVDPKDKKVAKSKISYKLGTLLPDRQFAVDPDAKDPLWKYVAWSPNEDILKRGAKKFNDHYDFLCKMSKLTMQMARKKYFGSDERMEMTHAVAGMLGCAEYGILSTEHWEVGYYDRIDDRYCQYLERDFASQKIQKQG